MSDKRNTLIATALPLFYQKGFHATGVEAVLAANNISKRTLYKHFRSKDALVLAVLAQYRTQTLTAIDRALKDHPGPAQAKIALLFEYLRLKIAAGGFLGCLATHAKLEYADKSPEIEAACVEFKQQIEQIFFQLSQEAGVKTPACSARQLLLLYEGALIYGQLYQQTDMIDAALALLPLILAGNTH
jgi:AcrR family transcriptional regulator